MALPDNKKDKPADDGPNHDVHATLERMLAAVYEAVKRAQVDVQRGASKKLDWFFPRDEQGNVSARTVSVPMPREDGSIEIREIPLFALVPHHDLMIEQVNVRLKLDLLRLTSSSGKPDVPELSSKLPKAGGDADQYAEIEVRLRGIEPIEGIARLNDAIVKRI
ncbi:MAG: DUF2589 domain-containing protein [Burkholderiales bacterium]|nr:DUF2589 domain-containing protein [Burkholderiales bacterium]